MADGIEEQAANESQQELATMMALHLNGQAPQQPDQPTLPDTPPPTTGDAIPPVAPVTPPEPPSFTFDQFKEKFGYEKPEDAISEIEQLRLLKANPPKAEIKYENEESRKLHLALQSGKKEDVYKILAEQDRLEKYTTQEVNKDSAADIIKLGMQLKYKDLSSQEIEHLYGKKYALPKQPVYNETTETEQEYQEKLDAWKEQVTDIEMTKVIDAKVLRPELEAAKQKLVLPEIESAAPDEAYLNYQKMISEAAELDAQTKEAYKTITPKDVETKVPFTDEASKVNFEFQYTPDEAVFKKAVEIASDNEQFFKTFLNSDGTPNRQMWIDAVMYALDKKAILTEAIKQGSNARIKSQLPDNDTGGLIRHLSTEVQTSELDQQMQQAGIGRMVGQ
jgi:hypothetical protein